jgi:hypothetical protein
MKNLTTEELVKTYYQAMMEASEAGNHKEVLSLYSELGKTSQEALIAVHKTQGFPQALTAMIESGAPIEMDKMQQQNEILEAKRKLHSLGYDEFFDEVHGFTRWEHTRTGHRPMDSDPRKVLKSLNKGN